MFHFKYLLLICFLMITGWVYSQKIVYSEPEREDSRRMNFEIIGKVGGNFLIYKNIRGISYVMVYDNEMQVKSKEKLDYLPTDRLINVDFFPYNDFSYIVYEYQRKSVVYCDAVKIDGEGKKVSDVFSLDTTHIGFAGNNKIYSAITNENKSKLMVFKINSRNRSRYVVTTVLFNDSLERLKRNQFVLPMDDSHDYLDDFNLDNEGGLVFTKFNRSSSETINNVFLEWLPPTIDTLMAIEVTKSGFYLDEPMVKIDNTNRRFFLTSFYSKQKRGNVEGLFFYVWDKESRSMVLQNSVELGDELRREAKSADASTRTAFNDFFIRNVIIKRDGGFVINTESYYTTSRFSNWNRWNYLYGSPFSYYDYYSYSPMYSSWWWRNRYDMPQAVRYHADNVAVLSFDKNGQLQWNNVLHKEQYDDETDDRISYQLVNTGGQIHYMFNLNEKRALLLNDFTLMPDGQMNHNPTLKNLDRGYEFLPKYGKQVSSHQVIMPCYYRNYICFAKIDFNL